MPLLIFLFVLGLLTPSCGSLAPAEKSGSDSEAVPRQLQARQLIVKPHDRSSLAAIIGIQVEGA